MSAGPLSAIQLEQQYKQLSVPLSGGQSVYVAVSHYRNNSSSTPDHSTVNAKEQAMKPLIAALRAQSKTDLGLKKNPTGSSVIVKRSAGETNAQEYGPGSQYDSVDIVSIIRTFVGKGSPADISATLALAVRLGRVAGNTNSLQQYVDNYVGLDCSGFVTNYLNLAYDAKIDVMNKSATSYREPAANRVGELEDILPRQIMAWAGTNHVAIIDSLDLDWLRLVAGKSTDGDLTGMQMTVVESNGSRGLNHATYTVKSVDSHKVFKVKRSYQSQLWRVYILDR